MTKPTDISNVAILGAGTMGANIALNLAAHGVNVRLTDVRSEQLLRARQTIEENARQLFTAGLLPESIEHSLSRLSMPPRRDEALNDVQLVIEAVPENLELKHRVFAELEATCESHVILASNTSTFMPSQLAAGLGHPATAERLLVMHYWNPAHLIPLVELVPHARTQLDVQERVRTLLERCGKQVVTLRKEIPGFIGNRLAFALQREAMSLVASGVATPGDIDTVTRASFGRRIPVTGIFQTADLGGLDVYLAVCQSIFPDLCRDTEAPPQLRQLVEAGRVGMKAGKGWNHYTDQEVAELKTLLTAELVRHARTDATNLKQFK
ncbi:MAG: 3-hydroxyacyl-CoA dehydrogenase family protein [Opitutus sp.]